MPVPRFRIRTLMIAVAVMGTLLASLVASLPDILAMVLTSTLLYLYSVRPNRPS